MFAKTRKVRRPPLERCALLLEVLGVVVDPGDAGLAVVEHPLGDVGLDLQARKSRSARPSQVVQGEGVQPARLEALEALREAPGQLLRVEGLAAPVGG